MHQFRFNIYSCSIDFFLFLFLFFNPAHINVDRGVLGTWCWDTLFPLRHFRSIKILFNNFFYFSETESNSQPSFLQSHAYAPAPRWHIEQKISYSSSPSSIIISSFAYWNWYLGIDKLTRFYIYTNNTNIAM